MADESYGFTAARTRLEEIVTQVRKKDTSLEKSLDLLEEGVRLANACTELIDQADWATGGAEVAQEDQPESGTEAGVGDMVVEDVVVTEEVVVYDADGNAIAEVVEVAEYVVLESASGEGEFGEVDDAWSEDAALAEEPGVEEDPASDER